MVTLVHHGIDHDVHHFQPHDCRIWKIQQIHFVDCCGAIRWIISQLYLVERSRQILDDQDVFHCQRIGIAGIHRIVLFHDEIIRNANIVGETGFGFQDVVLGKEIS